MIPITITARLGAEPELRFTKAGAPRAHLRLAVSKRVRDKATGEWSDTEPTWISATVWDALAEAVAESGLEKGTEVLVSGDLAERKWEGNDGQERRSMELTVRGIGPTITRRQRVSVSRALPPPSAPSSTVDDEWPHY